MDIRHDEDPVSDALLDQEIAKALAVEPSPEYVARVRAAIADGPAPAGWRLPWLWMGVGSAALAAALIIGVRPWFVSNARPVSAPAPAVAAAPPAAGPDVPMSLPERTPFERTARPAVSKAATRKPAAAPREPEVLIARDEAAALRRFMEGMRQGALESTAPATAVGDDPAGQPPSAIVVTPMPAIPPVAIAPLELDEGEQQ